jgi:hypothetical protein
MAEERYLIVNYVYVSEDEITVGVTDSERWFWEREDDHSGADAKTHLWATLTLKMGRSVSPENIGIYCAREDPLRALVDANINIVLELAWRVLDGKLDQQTAHRHYFGKALRELKSE